MSTPYNLIPIIYDTPIKFTIETGDCLGTMSCVSSDGTDLDFYFTVIDVPEKEYQKTQLDIADEQSIYGTHCFDSAEEMKKFVFQELKGVYVDFEILTSGF